MGDMSQQQPPPWGTPGGSDGVPGGDAGPDELPAWGTAPEDRLQAVQQAPGSSRPASGPLPRILTCDTIGVIERSGFMTSRSYELVASDGSALGHLSEEGSAGSWLFGTAASSTFTLQDAHGGLVATMFRPGSMSRFQFVVTDRTGAEAGVVEQENAFFAPQFELRPADGPVMRLTGGSMGGTTWELIDVRDESLLGRVSQEFAGLGGILGGTQRFAVRLSPLLMDSARLLALMAAICLDYVRDAKRRR